MRTTDQERLQKLEYTTETLTKGLDAMASDVRDIKRLLIGVDGENSLVSRVRTVEQEMKAHVDSAEKALVRVEGCLNPPSILDKPVKIKHLIIFAVAMSILTITESRNAILESIRDMLMVFTIF